MKTLEAREQFTESNKVLRARRIQHGKMFSPKLEDIWESMSQIELLKYIKKEAERLIDIGLYSDTATGVKDVMYGIVRRWWMWETGEDQTGRSWNVWCAGRGIAGAYLWLGMIRRSK